MASLSIWHWLIVLAVVILVLLTKSLGFADKDVAVTTGKFKKVQNLPMWFKVVVAFILLLYLVVIVQSLTAR